MTPRKESRRRCARAPGAGRRGREGRVEGNPWCLELELGPGSLVESVSGELEKEKEKVGGRRTSRMV